jgi:glycosyltransferase involved in cell wall biosynthesis
VDKKRNKICHLTSVHPPFDIRIFYKECASLANAGFEVFLIAPIQNKENRDGVEIIPIELPTSRLKRMLVVTFRMYLMAVKTKSPIFHFHDPELMLCGILLKLSGKKVIFDVHENVRLSLISKEWIPKALRGILGMLYFSFERIAILFYDKLILAEESYLKYYPHKKSIVVLNYPLTKNIEFNEREFLPPFKFVYSGVVHPLRGVWEMLAIIKQLVDSDFNVTLDLIGELRPADLQDKVINYIEANKLGSCVKIHGKVEYSKVSSFLSAADIVFSILQPIPNYKESLPTKIFEYMQHGLPVITNNFPLYKKYVADNYCGICIDFNNIEDAVGRITELLKEREKLMVMAKNGKSVTQNQYNWKSQEIKLLEVYSSM